MAIAKQGVTIWNEWRAANLRVQPDLTRINLSGQDLRGIDFRGVGLFKANLSACDLQRAILRQSIMIKTNLQGANLTEASIYGAAVWDVSLQGAIQRDLVITEPRQAIITTDNLEIAQFLHLILTNEKIRNVIDSITTKVVLILGRFTEDRKPVLDHIKHLTRARDLLPILFDFDGPRHRNTTETVGLLARLARFVIADLTTPASVPHELQSFVNDLDVPVAPIIERGQQPYSMFQDLQRYPWMLDTFEYGTLEEITTEVFPSIVSLANRYRLAQTRRS
jgi:Pentapeptide repeats (8 copies)